MQGGPRRIHQNYSAQNRYFDDQLEQEFWQQPKTGPKHKTSRQARRAKGLRPIWDKDWEKNTFPTDAIRVLEIYRGKFALIQL